MNLIRITSLASVGFAVLVEPAFAGQPVPGPIAGIGLPALVLIGWRILGSSKVFWRQGEKSTRDNPSGECPLSGVKRTCQVVHDAPRQIGGICNNYLLTDGRSIRADHRPN